MSLISVEAALKSLLAGVKQTNIEQVPLLDAGARVLAKDVRATRTQPPFSASAMDGYAVRASDTTRANDPLRVIGEAPAGQAYKGSLKQGEALRIFTGAPIPDGANAVLIQENAHRDGEMIYALQPVDEGKHIRAAGLDFSQDDTLLHAGQQLDYRALALAGAMNHPTLPVYCKPRVAILANGDELVEPGQIPGPNQIIASNQIGIAELVRRSGAIPVMLGIAPDNEQEIAKRVTKAITLNCDILVTLGGASVGDHDLIQKTLGNAGMDLEFWRIAMRPGKPLMAGSIGEMKVLGLPGNPVSSLVCGLLFLVPLIQTMLGQSPATNPTDHPVLPLASPLPQNDMRQDYVRARIVSDSGRETLQPFKTQDSSMLSLFHQSQALIIRPPHAPEASEGKEVPYIPL